MGGVAAAVELQQVDPNTVAKEHPQHFRPAVPMLAVVPPRAHYKLRFLRRFHNRRVVPSSYRIFYKP